MTNNSYVSDTRVPDIAHERSRFVKQYRHTTTCTAGKLVPFMAKDCLPGSTFSFDTAHFERMLTPVFPVMDDCRITIAYFFVPYRLIHPHFVNMMGENDSLTKPWVQPGSYVVPHITTSSTFNFQPKSVADHFGFPTGVNGISVSQYPFRAYCFVWNTFFRNQNTDVAAYWPTTDADISAGSSAYQGGSLLDVSREHDFFSDALPTAEKLDYPSGISFPDVRIPVYSGDEWPAGTFPITGEKFATSYSGSNYSRAGGSLYANNSGMLHIPSTSSDTGVNNPQAPTTLGWNAGGIDLFTVNQLRQAFAMQRYGERLALGGSRYVEILSSFFGLTVQDSRLQRPEFLGSQTFSINMAQVVQTSETTSSGTPQGNVSGNSVTAGKGARVVYSTQEHGVLLGVFWIRHSRSYQQGIDPEWSRRTKFDFYQTPFAHIGMVPLFNRALYADGSSNDGQPFGYVEYGDELRYPISHVTGEMRSSYSQSLDAWHYADNYSSRPTLSQAWMAEGATEIARTLAITNPIGHDQFLVQFQCDLDMTLPIPMRSTPGLVDHF